MKPNKFPFLEPNTVRKNIQRFHSMEWPVYVGSNTMDYAKYMQLMESKIMDVFGYMSLIFINDYRNTSMKPIVYRARPLDQITNKLLISEYSYPPTSVSYLIGNQRANLKGFPAFYGSSIPMTAIKESIGRNTKLSTLAITRWRFNKDIPVPIIALTTDLEKIKNGHLKQNTIFENLIKDGLSDSQIDGFIILHDFYSSLFLDDNHRSVSSFLGNFFLYQQAFQPILSFPSIQMNKATNNYAIHPNIVDQAMNIERIYFMQLKNFNLEGENYKVDLTPDKTFMLASPSGQLQEFSIDEHSDIFEKIFYEDFVETTNKYNFLSIDETKTS